MQRRHYTIQKGRTLLYSGSASGLMCLGAASPSLPCVAAEQYTGKVLDPGNVTYRAYRSVMFVVSMLVSPDLLAFPTASGLPSAGTPAVFHLLTCASAPPLLARHRRQLSMRINRGFTRWWDARNAFRGAGSAVVALCYQMPVWGVDPAIHVRLMCRVAW